MSAYTLRDPQWRSKVRDSFSRQAFMTTLGAEIADLSPGLVDLTAAFSPALTQQHGFFHAGVTTSLADSAAGYAALTLFPPDHGVLTTEFKVNLLNPGRGTRLVARGRVVKAGRTLTIASGDVYGHAGDEDDAPVHIATGLFSLMALAGMDG